MAALGMLSRTGRCRTFDAAADGFVRSDGCGMVVLKRLAEAETDGDCIWAVIRGAAVNQNGASAGPTVPNGPAQERVIEEALAQAGVLPSDVDYLEAHEAGSALGDPIEVNAAAAVDGRERSPDRPLLIGSVKTNIGHLESAAGVAGLIKVALAMRHGAIPKNLHFHDPNPHLEWDRLPIRVVSETVDWPQDPDRPPRAGVSAFGISGVNAHVVLEGYGDPNGVAAGALQRVAPTLSEPAASLTPSEEAFSARDTRLLPLSAKPDEALRALAGRYLSWLDEHADALAAERGASDTLLSDMTWTAAVGRSQFGHRAGVVFQDAASLRQSLIALAQADAEPGPGAATKVAFVYTGETDRWVSMGGALFACEPVVRAVLNRCDAVIAEDRGASLLDAMFGGPVAEGG